jgi:hypothetical protein
MYVSGYVLSVSSFNMSGLDLLQKSKLVRQFSGACTHYNDEIFASTRTSPSPYPHISSVSLTLLTMKGSLGFGCWEWGWRWRRK